MPRLTRWFVRAALAWLVVGLVTGVASIAPASIGLPERLAAVSPLYVHYLVLGWATQLIFGVAWWMFPIHSRERPYVSPPIGWAVFASLNVGLLVRTVAEGAPASGHAAPGWSFALSALLQWLAGMLFVAVIWPRVKVRGS